MNALYNAAVYASFWQKYLSNILKATLLIETSTFRLIWRFAIFRSISDKVVFIVPFHFVNIHFIDVEVKDYDNLVLEECRLLGCYSVWLLGGPPKRRFLQEPHGVTSQKTAFLIVTTVKTSNVTIQFFTCLTARSATLTTEVDQKINNWELTKNIDASKPYIRILL
jgi:hypothetical protein